MALINLSGKPKRRLDTSQFNSDPTSEYKKVGRELAGDLNSSYGLFDLIRGGKRIDMGSAKTKAALHRRPDLAATLSAIAPVTSLTSKNEDRWLYPVDRAQLNILAQGEVQANFTYLPNAIERVPPQRAWYSCGYNAVTRCLILNGVANISYAELKRHTPCRLGKIRGPLWPEALAQYVSKHVAATGLRAVCHAPPTWEAAEALMRGELTRGRPVIALVKGWWGAVGQLAQHYRLIISLAQEGCVTLETDGNLYEQNLAGLAALMRMDGPVIGVLRGFGLYHRYNVLTLTKVTTEA